MNKMPCLPVKITDKQWADKLQDGSVFMRSLHEYGSWSAVKRAKENDQKMKSGVQGDVMEGVVRRVDPQEGDEFIKLLPDDLRAVMKESFYIDQELYQYAKIYCMYGLTYLIDQESYEKPNDYLSEFGDTAVIFLNPDEFVNRVLIGLNRSYGDNYNFRVDEVRYYPSNYYGPLDEFCKHERFAWQNELRMRVFILDPLNYIIGQDGRKRKQLIQTIAPITVEIGDIRDISVQISIEDLINLNLRKKFVIPNFKYELSKIFV